MDEKKKLVLKHLRKNSREKLTSMSRKTGIPISTLFDNLKDLEKEAIDKFTILLNFSTLGFETRAQVFLKVPHGQKDEIKEHLEKHEDVNSLYKINNGWNFIVETVHRSINDLDCFVENLEKRFLIEAKEIHYIIDEIVREKFLVEA